MIFQRSWVIRPDIRQVLLHAAVSQGSPQNDGLQHTCDGAAGTER
jgi:hypothetical protein